MRPITILLVDDHPIVRHGVKALLMGEADLKILGEAGDGLEAMRMVQGLQPDVLIVDVILPGLGGLEVTRQVKTNYPRTRIVVLSMYADDVYVAEALRQGASGYVIKDSGTTELIKAVRAAAAGRRYLSPPLSQRMIQEYVQSGREQVLDPYDTLTPRERQVLHLTTDGCTAEKIAASLSISPRTVEIHRANLERKLGLHSVADLVIFASKRGLIKLN